MTMWQSGMGHGSKNPWIGKFMGLVHDRRREQSSATSTDKTQERYDPMIYIFPRVTKCTFHKYGSSGSIQTHDSLCVLPLNMVNEKTYIFLWFWYLILAVVLALLVIYSS
ncbi:hypothetical protein MSG28_000061 [Choristoneura fumiferana]|uniref:Uncharacterized protein n=1 Tax=Choristoneura fumiferana TaxID=7141 RepID=A0ACC0JZ75_CHOFU|nr:hypothetical protein MSG28_000061 [Choristoneura fumiferana]